MVISKSQKCIRKLVCCLIGLLVLVSWKFSLKSSTSDNEILEDHFLSRKLLWEPWENCTSPAILNFPDPYFPQNPFGQVVLPMVILVYLYIALMYVCEYYFFPSLTTISLAMGLEPDTVGASLMAGAASAPELFIAITGTFLTEGDIGVGTIVGASVFNMLAIPGLCAFFYLGPEKGIKLDYWPLSRDAAVYALAVIALAASLNDDLVRWYEALLMVIFYVVYILMLHVNTKLRSHTEWFCKKLKLTKDEYSSCPLLADQHMIIIYDSQSSTISSCQEAGSDDEFDFSPFNIPQGKWSKLGFLLSWPVRLVLFLTIPPSQKSSWSSFYAATALISCTWIGVISYLIAWMITIVGYRLNIPDSLMGLTIIAAGLGVPDAMSCISLAKKGEGGQALSNALGSNTFNILLCLGLPWLIKASFFPAPNPTSEHYVDINSEGLQYSAFLVITCLLCVFAVLAWTGFHLNRVVGYWCLSIYSVYLLLATLLEMNVFFQVNLPMCNIKGFHVQE